jgi:lysophospholipase L1-like esterase
MKTRMILALGGAAALLVACQLGVWMGDPADPAVVVIGDSLIFQAEGNYGLEDGQRALAQALVDAGYQAHVTGFIGETLPAGYRDLWPSVPSPPAPDVLVIALGTNDSHDGAVPLADSRAALSAWLTEAAAVPCVVLVEVNEAATDWQLDVYGPAYNDMLADEALSHPRAFTVPWAPDPALMDSAQIHFAGEQGRAAYRQIILDGVARCAAP